MINILIIGSEEIFETEELGTRTKQLSDFISKVKNTRVVVVNNPSSLLYRIKRHLKGKKNIDHKYKKIEQKQFSSLYKKNESLFFINTISFFPVSLYDEIKFLKKMEVSIKNLLQTINFNADHMLIASHKLYKLNIECGKKIFLPTDNMKFNPKMVKEKEKIAASYKWADKKADAVIVASEKQKKDFKREDVQIISNGVSSVFFNDYTDNEAEDLKNIQHPRIIYVGVMQRRLNTDLVYKVANLLPDHSFIFVGPILEENLFSDLEKLPNIHLLGKKQYCQLPRYLQNADCGIVPHHINEFTESMDPLKIYEYLSAGLQVVSTPVNGTDQCFDLIELASEADDFAEKIKSSIPKKPFLKGREYVRSKTWEKQSEKLIKFLQSL